MKRLLPMLFRGFARYPAHASGLPFPGAGGAARRAGKGPGVRLLLLLACACVPCRAALGADEDAPILCLETGGHTDTVTYVGFTPDGSHLVSTSYDATIRIWDVGGRHLSQVIRPWAPADGKKYIATAQLSPDGAVLAATVRGVGHQCIRIEDGRVLRTFPGIGWALAFSPDGTLLAAPTDGNAIALWDLADGRCRATLKGHEKLVQGLAFSADGTKLASVDEGRGTRFGGSRGVSACGRSRVRRVSVVYPGLVMASPSSLVSGVRTRRGEAWLRGR